MQNCKWVDLTLKCHYSFVLTEQCKHKILCAHLTGSQCCGICATASFYQLKTCVFVWKCELFSPLYVFFTSAINIRDRCIFVCRSMLADRHACTHAVASVFIICACVLWRSGKSTEGFPKCPRCQSMCSVKGEDHLPGLGEISATCRCWGIYPSMQGKKTNKAGGGGGHNPQRVGCLV